ENASELTDSEPISFKSENISTTNDRNARLSKNILDFEFKTPLGKIGKSEDKENKPLENNLCNFAGLSKSEQKVNHENSNLPPAKPDFVCKLSNENINSKPAKDEDIFSSVADSIVLFS